MIMVLTRRECLLGENKMFSPLKILTSGFTAAAIVVALAGTPVQAEPISLATVATATAVGKTVFGGHPNTAPNKAARGLCNLVSNPFKKRKNSC